MIYLTQNARIWITQRIMGLKSDGYYEGVETPKEQLADVFRRFIVNEPINAFKPKTLIKRPDWLHEIRTADLRIFGWFWRERYFIASTLSLKRDLADNKITYEGCLEQCRSDRASLMLDPPKYIDGDVDDLLRL